jgi:hypothetical protein
MSNLSFNQITENIPAMLVSDYRPLCNVELPYKGRRHYMHSFDLSAPKMRDGFEDYLDIVMALCESAGAKSGTAHMTVDEKVVVAGKSQRRPGPHVDGVFMPDKFHPVRNAMGSWGGGGRWNHYCNDIGVGPVRRMPVIVAASEIGCRVWRGVFDATPSEDGDLSGLVLDAGEVVPAGAGYLLSPDCVHESMIQEKDVARTFLRIALPIDFCF